MKSLKKGIVFAIAGFCLLMGGIYWISHSGLKSSASRQSSQPKTHQFGQQHQPLGGPSGSQAISEPAAPVVESEEVAATRQMYAAHAPLRTPEVSDPDSATNRQILQAMVEKAMLRNAQKETIPENPSEK